MGNRKWSWFVLPPLSHHYIFSKWWSGPKKCLRNRRPMAKTSAVSSRQNKLWKWEVVHKRESLSSRILCFHFTIFALCAEGLQNRNQNILINNTKYKRWQSLPEENEHTKHSQRVAKPPNTDDVFLIFSPRLDFEWTFYFLVSDSEFSPLLLSNEGKSCQLGESFILRLTAWNKHQENNCTPVFKSEKASQICFAFENLAKECISRAQWPITLFPGLCALCLIGLPHICMNIILHD